MYNKADSNEVKLKKFKNAIRSFTSDQLLELRDTCLEKLEDLPGYIARGTYMFKALNAIEDRMVEKGVA
jgi:hypothetical protein